MKKFFASLRLKLYIHRKSTVCTNYLRSYSNFITFYMEQAVYYDIFGFCFELFWCYLIFCSRNDTSVLGKNNRSFENKNDNKVWFLPLGRGKIISLKFRFDNFFFQFSWNVALLFEIQSIVAKLIFWNKNLHFFLCH